MWPILALGPSPASPCPFLLPKTEDHLGKDLEGEEPLPNRTRRETLCVIALGAPHLHPLAKSHHLLIYRKSREDGNTQENMAEQPSLWP